jgi:hypothetical protein
VSDAIPGRDEPWPWDQAPNAAALTVRSILDGAPILYVFHDVADDGWQLLDGEPPDTNEGRLIGIHEVPRLDASLWEIADLPPGWMAWRDWVGGSWSREPNPRTEDG